MSRIIELPKRSGFYVEINVPLWVRKLGLRGNTVRRKAGKTRAEAVRNAALIEAELQREWSELQDQLEEKQPLKKARSVAQSQGLDLPEVVEDLMKDAGLPKETRDAVMLAFENEAEVQKQKEGGFIKPKPLDRQTQALVDGLNSGSDPWQEWVRIRKIEERNTAASTVANWEVKLRGLAKWYGSDHLGTITKEQAHNYKLFMLSELGYKDGTCRGCLSCFSAFWNWGLRSGKLEGQNPWEGLKKGLSTKSNRKALEPQKLIDAEIKADKLEDIRFWFGRYQGLRKEDYCGLRWCDIDMDKEVIHLVRYEWEGKKRNLKLKEGGERMIPIHSKVVARIKTMLPEAFTRTDDEPIWKEDYKPSLENWGSRFAERFTDRYGFGSHDLRSYVVTQMLKQNINPYFLKVITGHTVPGLGKVVAGYVQPTIEEVREVLEQLD